MCNKSLQELQFIVQGQKNMIAIQAKQMEDLIHHRNFCEHNEDVHISGLKRSIEQLERYLQEQRELKIKYKM